MIRIANGGRTAATAVQGWIYLEAEKLGPYQPPPLPKESHSKEDRLSREMRSVTADLAASAASNAPTPRKKLGKLLP